MASSAASPRRAALLVVTLVGALVTVPAFVGVAACMVVHGPASAPMLLTWKVLVAGSLVVTTGLEMTAEGLLGRHQGMLVAAAPLRLMEVRPHKVGVAAHRGRVCACILSLLLWLLSLLLLLFLLRLEPLLLPLLVTLMFCGCLLLGLLYWCCVR